MVARTRKTPVKKQMGLKKHAFRIMCEQPTHTFSNAELQAALKKEVGRKWQVSSISTTMGHLVRARLVTRVGRGQYRLAPGVPQQLHLPMPADPAELVPTLEQLGTYRDGRILLRDSSSGDLFAAEKL